MMMWELFQPYPGGRRVRCSSRRNQNKTQKIPAVCVGGREVWSGYGQLHPHALSARLAPGERPTRNHAVCTLPPKAVVVRSNAMVLMRSLFASRGGADSVFSHRELARAAGNIPITFRFPDG
jgi:hypothetical protein